MYRPVASLYGNPSELLNERKFFLYNEKIKKSISSGVNDLPSPMMYHQIFQSEVYSTYFLNSYSPPKGCSLLRKALELYERALSGELDADISTSRQVCLTVGATSAITFFFEYMAVHGHHNVLF